MTEQLFGYVPIEDRTPAEMAKHNAIMASLPEFKIEGSWSHGRKVALYDAPRKVFGSTPFYVHQTTGSCVGANGWNALVTLMAVEIALGGERESAEQCWWLYTYGESRELSGMRGRGDGSTGSGWAKAITTKGIFKAAQPGLPLMTNKSGWLWLPADIERQWSAGDIDSAKWDGVAKDFVCQTAAECRSADDVAKAIQNGYPCTVAGSFGTSGPRRAGGDDNPVMLADWNATWPHQMTFDGWQEHPTLGELFRNGNSWGPGAHPAPVDDSPAGGFWVTKSVVDRRCREGEVFALSKFKGFPARTIDWAIL